MALCQVSLWWLLKSLKGRVRTLDEKFVILQKNKNNNNNTNFFGKLYQTINGNSLKGCKISLPIMFLKAVIYPEACTIKHFTAVITYVRK